MMDLQTFALINLNSALDLIIDTLQPETDFDDDNDKCKDLMYDEEVEKLLVSFIDDIFALMSAVVGDASHKITTVVEDAYLKITTTRKNLIRSVRQQMGSRLIVSCSLLLSFLSLWISVLQMAGMQTWQLRRGMSLTLSLIRTLETANQNHARRSTLRGFFRRSKSLIK